ncbi:MAG: T9SS type A sorting domain-containing protein [bacterium]|nr:T9SS type A sorting domain-containing protein [bacterium]
MVTRAFVTTCGPIYSLPRAAPGNASTIYDPDYYWGAIVYEKGGCVLHMLRWVMGDSLFFEALRDYGQQHAFSTATTVDFQAVCEAHCDSTLQWFFDEWVFEGTGYPQYQVTLRTSDIAVLEIDQTQTGTQFTMPVEVEYWRGDGSFIALDTIWVNPDSLYYRPIGLPDSVSFDPNGWLLKSSTVRHLPLSELTKVSEDFTVSYAYPNPFNPTLTIAYDSPRPQPVTMRAYNVQGQLAVEKTDMAAAGSNTLVWNAENQASGVYLIKLSTQNETRTVKAVLLK